MDVASRVTISSCYRQHRHQEFLRFLNDIDANLPQGFDVHLVMDNYGTHKVTKVRTWLTRHPRYQVHFTPTSGSWLNLVERLFAEVTERCVRRAEATRPFDRWRRQCSTTWISATKIPSRLYGRQMPTSSWARSPGFLNAFLTQDTREARTITKDFPNYDW
jgi:transposase